MDNNKKTARYCVDCRHYRKDAYCFGLQKHTCLKPFGPASGECGEMRRGECGPEGRLWEAKDD